MSMLFILEPLHASLAMIIMIRAICTITHFTRLVVHMPMMRMNLRTTLPGEMMMHITIGIRMT